MSAEPIKAIAFNQTLAQWFPPRNHFFIQIITGNVILSANFDS
jgi:hypothetical protein